MSGPDPVAIPGRTARRSRSAPGLARLVSRLGGRYSRELDLDLDRDPDVERWFCAATLFGTRIGAEVAMRTYRTLRAAGVATVTDAAARPWDDLVALLDAGGYTRYDYRTATRLQRLGAAVAERFGGRVAPLGRTVTDPEALEACLDALPGWGPTTVRVFLRELRGRWPGACPPLDPRAAWALAHLRLSRSAQPDLRTLARLAATADLDLRDAEAALIRAALAHRRARVCAGGSACAVWDRREHPQPRDRPTRPARRRPSRRPAARR
jgi:hypothetical protein